MKINKSKAFSFAIIAKSHKIERLYDAIADSFENVKIIGYTNNNSEIEFLSKEELLNFENTNYEKLIGIRFYNFEKINIKLKIGFTTYQNIYFNDNSSYDMSYDDMGWGMKIEKDLNDKFTDMKAGYSILSRGDFRVILPFLFSLFLTFLWLYRFLTEGFKEVSNAGSTIQMDVVNVLILICLALALVGWIVNKFKDYLFPRVIFDLGDQIEENKKRRYYRNLIFIVIILGFTISFFASYLNNFLI